MPAHAGTDPDGPADDPTGPEAPDAHGLVHDTLDEEGDDNDSPDHDGLDEDGGQEDGPGRAFVYDATIGPHEPAMAALLAGGDIEVLGLMPWSSNGTYLVEVHLGDDHAPAVYKPEGGERPLWDFPGGLWRREVAAFELSEAMGLGLVPPTAARAEAPMGPGSVQAFVPARFSEHYFTFRDIEAHLDVLRALCAFDLVANSADRKGGHCLIDEHDRIWAIDNGLSFHVEFKVRTVIWDFAGEALPGEVAESLLRALASLERLTPWIDHDELDAVERRATRLLAEGHFPHDPSGRRYPWPLV